MRITHLSTAVMESNFDWTIVKVETDDHITGYGEAFLGPGLTAVIQEFGEILKGEDPTSIDRVLRRMRARCRWIAGTFWNCRQAARSGIACRARTVKRGSGTGFRRPCAKSFGAARSRRWGVHPTVPLTPDLPTAGFGFRSAAAQSI